MMSWEMDTQNLMLKASINLGVKFPPLDNLSAFVLYPRVVSSPKNVYEQHESLPVCDITNSMQLNEEIKLS